MKRTEVYGVQEVTLEDGTKQSITIPFDSIDALNRYRNAIPAANAGVTAATTQPAAQIADLSKVAQQPVKHQVGGSKK